MTNLSPDAHSGRDVKGPGSECLSSCSALPLLGLSLEIMNEAILINLYIPDQVGLKLTIKKSNSMSVSTGILSSHPPSQRQTSTTPT